jgi:multidrug efflux pump subunit AcrB
MAGKQPDSGLGEMRGGPIAWMARNPVAANLLMACLLFGGFHTAKKLKQEVFPEFEIDVVTVTVPYPGASPGEVERGIVLAIEEAIRGLDGIEEVTSQAREGGATVWAELLLGADRQEAYQDIQQAVNRITTFPEDAEEARVALASRRRQVISLVLYGEQSEAVLRDTAEYVRDDLLQDPLITQVDLSGVRDYEVEVAISRDVLESHGLTIEQVARRIGQTAVEIPGGGIKTAGGEILLRVKERRDAAREFRDIPVLTADDGATVRLGDIAQVRDTFQDVDLFATYNGKRAVMLDIFRIGDQTPTEVAAAARRHLRNLNEALPPGLDMAVLSDRSVIFRQRAQLLMRNGAIGLVLVLLLLGIFLEARLAFWVMMGIPISFLGGFLFLPGLDISINMISMFAFLIALGIVVDDAIVVGENVYEYHQRGKGLLESAVRGAREVAMPVTFSVLTNVVAFLPLFVVPGFIGKIWRVIPAVVCTVFLVSLAECLLVLPAHLGHSRSKPRTVLGGWFHSAQQGFSRGFIRTVEAVYGPFLRWVLGFRYVVLAVAVGLMILTIGYMRGGRIAQIPFPRVDSDYSVVTAALPYGSPVESTMRVREILEKSAWQVASRHGGEELVTGVFSIIGGGFRGSSGGHVLEVRAQLTDPEVRPISTRQFTDEWRQATGPIAGLEALSFQSDRGGPGSGAAISLELAHADSATLDRASSDLAEYLAGFPAAKDIDDGYSPGKPQLDFEMLPEGEGLGLTSAEVARQVRSAFYGSEALRQQRGRNEVRVEVRLPENERLSEFDLEQLRVRTPAGTFVPLHEVASVRRGRAYTSIDRRDGRRTVTVSANVTQPKEAGIIIDDISGGNDKPGLVKSVLARFRPPSGE